MNSDDLKHALKSRHDYQLIAKEYNVTTLALSMHIPKGCFENCNYCWVKNTNNKYQVINTSAINHIVRRLTKTNNMLPAPNIGEIIKAVLMMSSVNSNSMPGIEPEGMEFDLRYYPRALDYKYQARLIHHGIKATGAYADTAENATLLCWLSLAFPEIYSTINQDPYNHF